MAPVQAVHDGLDLGQGTAQVLVGIQPHGCHLDQDCVDAGLDHGLQQLRLGLVPQECQGGQPQSRAHLHARPVCIWQGQRFLTALNRTVSALAGSGLQTLL